MRVKDPERPRTAPYIVQKDLYKGIYSGYWGDYKVFEILGVLTISRIRNERSDLFQLKIIPEEKHTFRVFAKDIKGPRGK